MRDVNSAATKQRLRGWRRTYEFAFVALCDRAESHARPQVACWIDPDPKATLVWIGHTDDIGRRASNFGGEVVEQSHRHIAFAQFGQRALKKVIVSTRSMQHVIIEKSHPKFSTAKLCCLLAETRRCCALRRSMDFQLGMLCKACTQRRCAPRSAQTEQINEWLYIFQ